MGKQQETITFKAKLAKKIETGVGGAVLGCAVSPDDSIAASCSADNKILLWDIETGGCIGTLEGHTAEVTACSFGNDLLASGDKNGTIILWKYKEQKRASRIVVHQDRINNVVISPNSNFLASCSEDGTGRVFAIQGGEGEFIQGLQSRILEGHTAAVNDIAFSADSQAVVTCSNDGHSKIYDTVTGECLITLEGHGGKILKCGFKRDGRQIVTMTRMCVSIWSISKRQVAWEIEDKEGNGFQTLCMHPTSSMFLLVGMDGTICGYSMSTKSQVCQAKSASIHSYSSSGHNGPVMQCQFSGSGQRAITGGIDGKILIWV